MIFPFPVWWDMWIPWEDIRIPIKTTQTFQWKKIRDFSGFLPWRKSSQNKNHIERPRPSAMMVIWMPVQRSDVFFVKEGNLENALFFLFFSEKGGKTIVDRCEEVAINAIWEIIYEILELCTQWIFSWSLDECRNFVRLWRCCSSFRLFGKKSHTSVTKFRWSSIEFDEMVLRRILSSFDLGLQLTEVCSNNSSSWAKLKLQNEISCDMRAIPAIISSWNLRI